MSLSEAPYSTLLEEALEAWEDVRRGILEEAAALPDDEYGFRPHDEARSFQEILRHILESGLMAMGELARPDGDFTRQGFPAFIREYAGDLPEVLEPEALLDHLRMSFAEGAASLRAAGDLHMLQTIRRFDGLSGTRLTWLHHHLAHEMYHRGQLALYVRQSGRLPALTARIQGG